MRTTLAAAVLAAAALTAFAVPVPDGGSAVTRDATGFVPYRKHQVLPGKVIGVLVPDAAAVLGAEGRFGPPDQLCLGTGGGSYRWVYVPVEGNALITNLKIQAGPDGSTEQVYPKLTIASAAVVKASGVPGGYSLVEAEVNGGLGAPEGDAFVATALKRLDGTEDYPLKVAEVVAALTKEYETFRKDHTREIDEAMAAAAKDALGQGKPTGPRDEKTLTFVSWLPEKNRLLVRFKTRLTDGDYKFSGGGANLEDRPPPALPVKPGRPVPPPPPPPRDLPAVRYGTSFGIDHGVGYEVDRAGKVVAEVRLKPVAFKEELPPPPAVDRPRPLPLPLPPAPPAGKP